LGRDSRRRIGACRGAFWGTYTLTNNEYVETQDFGDATWMKDNGKSFRFMVKVEGDTMTQFGVDNPYTEVWKRVRQGRTRDGSTAAITP
jgi:hypothetical protein